MRILDLFDHVTDLTKEREQVYRVLRQAVHDEYKIIAQERLYELNDEIVELWEEIRERTS